MRTNKTTTPSSRNSVNRMRARLLAGCVLSFGLLAGGGEAMASCDISGSMSGFSTGLTTCTVTESGTYQVTVVGGAGGTFYQSPSTASDFNSSTTSYGGYGAEVTGEISMTAGQVYDIITGISAPAVYGSSNPSQAPSGGGASALVLVGTSSFTPIVVAGAGSAGMIEGTTTGVSDGTGGNNIVNGSSETGIGGATGTSAGIYSYGGGGGGWSSSGASSSGGGTGGGGFSPPSGLMQGGTGGYLSYSLAYGGGGGGYTGGAGDGFGGYSYYSPTLVSSVAGTAGQDYIYNSSTDTTLINTAGNTAAPEVSLALISASGQSGTPSPSTSVPEPSSLLILAAGLGALFVARRGVGRQLG